MSLVYIVLQARNPMCSMLEADDQETLHDRPPSTESIRGMLQLLFSLQLTMSNLT
jgi:hypothetical protein